MTKWVILLVIWLQQPSIRYNWSWADDIYQLVWRNTVTTHERLRALASWSQACQSVSYNCRSLWSNLMLVNNCCQYEWRYSVWRRLRFGRVDRKVSHLNSRESAILGDACSLLFHKFARGPFSVVKKCYHKETRELYAVKIVDIERFLSRPGLSIEGLSSSSLNLLSESALWFHDSRLSKRSQTRSQYMLQAQASAHCRAVWDISVGWIPQYGLWIVRANSASATPVFRASHAQFLFQHGRCRHLLRDRETSNGRFRVLRSCC